MPGRTGTGRFSGLVVRRIGFGYMVSVPKGGAGRRLPLMIFLHGAGERGTDLSLLRKHGPLKKNTISMAKDFIVVAPQCPEGDRWHPDQIEAFLDHLLEKYPVDPERVYVTGVSMGGLGALACGNSFSKRIAAIVAVCPVRLWPIRADRLPTVPLWIFHGAMDGTVPVSDSANNVQQVRAMGGKVRFTVYPDADHDSWSETFLNPEVYAWLLKHRTTRKIR